MPLAGLAGSGPEGRIIERDVQAALSANPGMTAAARAAAAGGANVPASGSGLGGRVTLGDMAAAPSAAATVATAITGEGDITETPIKGIRKLISDRMSQSLSETAQLTLNADAKAAAIEAYRARLKASDESLG
ncbi:MAG: 2-oxo acid dehydrogenase subunit E2, partial [Treponema sp.]|nr:2-oxo acid dehydrogenase subunit E2 [Treponema sp.]